MGRLRLAPASLARGLCLLATLGLATSALAVVGVSSDGARFADRVVMILTRGPEGAGFCTGVVVAPSAVLTAAHCLKPARDMLVFTRGAQGEERTWLVAEAAANPRYAPNAIRERTPSVDLALVKTATPFGPEFHAPNLSDEEEFSIGAPAVLVGFGARSEGDRMSEGALRVATLKVRQPLSRLLLWAADSKGGAGACSGDSGAPIFSADERTVIATVAWSAGDGGRRCGALTQGPLIAPNRAWIDATLAKWR